MNSDTEGRNLGVDQRPQCVIAPPEYNTQPYHLVEPKIVRERLLVSRLLVFFYRLSSTFQKFRTALRCEQTWIDQVNNVGSNLIDHSFFGTLLKDSFFPRTIEFMFYYLVKTISFQVVTLN